MKDTNSDMSKLTAWPFRRCNPDQFDLLALYCVRLLAMGLADPGKAVNYRGSGVMCSAKRFTL